jgi:hypothetical protein
MRAAQPHSQSQLLAEIAIYDVIRYIKLQGLLAGKCGVLIGPYLLNESAPAGRAVLLFSSVAIE